MSFLTELPEDFYARDALRGFDPAGPFSLGTARAMMWLSQLAYEGSPEKIDKIRQLWNLDSAVMVPGAISTHVGILGTAAIVAARPDAVIIAFGGTDPIRLANWITDFSVDLPPRDTHSGFQNATDAIWSKLSSLITALRSSGNVAPIFLTGHSLGGALAVLTAEKAAQNEHVAGIYTFGMPRVGRTGFTARYASLTNRTFRLHFGQDIVPTVPMPEAGFRHVGLYLHCGVGRFAQVGHDPQPSNEPALVQSLLDEVRNFLRRPSPLGLPSLSFVRMLLPNFLNPAPSSRPDLLGVLLEQFPPAIRDHLPHRYLGAL